MALVPATITVTFTSNYVGPHRVCYRTNMSGGYTCVNVTCLGGGATCSTNISILVDTETCTSVEFDGYVQPTCEDIASPDNQTPFSVVFTPSPTCQSWQITCESVSVASVTMTTAGSGYDPASAPSVSFSGGGGSGAMGSAVVGAGALTLGLVSLIGSGSGYTDGTYTGVHFLGGTGSGALGTVVISGGVVVSITLTTAGTGYLTTDTLRPDPSDLGPSTPTTNATFTAPSNYGKITGITMISGGVGYTSVPTLVIAPPSSGTTAGGTPVLDTCAQNTFYSCDLSTSANAKFSLGASTIVCATSAPRLTSDYTVVNTGACPCNCTTYTLDTSGSIEVSSYVTYAYYGCDGSLVTGTLYPGGSPSSLTFCGVTGSVVVKNHGAASHTLTVGGACS